MEYIQHHGIKGMKWGVRRYQNKDGSLTPTGKKRSKKKIPQSWTTRTKSGEVITVTKDRGTLLGDTLQKLTGQDFATYTSRNSEGKKVGHIQLDRKSKDEMNIVWMDTNKKHKGKGYAAALLETGEKIAREAGAKKLTAEVVGNSPDMQHITDKRGYVRKGEIRTQDVLDVWGGLTLVELDLLK